MTNPTIAKLTEVLYLTQAPASAIADKAGLSVSRTRELLKQLIEEGVVVKDDSVRPAEFSLATPHDDEEVEGKEEWVAAGEPGTFLGDSAIRNTETNEVVNKFTKEPIASAAKALVKKKRVILNPQPTIERKRKALAKVGATLEFDKNEREWTVGVDGEPIHTMTAKDLAGSSPEDLVKKVEAV